MHLPYLPLVPDGHLIVVIPAPDTEKKKKGAEVSACPFDRRDVRLHVRDGGSVKYYDSGH